MPKTPDEIKKGLECCITDKCRECPYYPLYEVYGCKLARAKDTLAYIQQLEAQNAEQDEKIRRLETSLMAEMSETKRIHVVDLNDDAAIVIQQFEADNAQLNRCIENMTDKLNAINDEVAKLQAERDAAVEDLKMIKDCKTCKYFGRASYEKPCSQCGIGQRNWQWRGVQKEE